MVPASGPLAGSRTSWCTSEVGRLFRNDPEVTQQGCTMGEAGADPSRSRVASEVEIHPLAGLSRANHDRVKGTITGVHHCSKGGRLEVAIARSRYKENVVLV